MTMPTGVLKADVVQVVRDMGQASIDDIVRALTKYTRKQVSNAIDNAKRDDLVKLMTAGQRGPHGVPGYYAPSEGKSRRYWVRTNRQDRHKKPSKMFSSVFDMAGGPVVIPAWTQPARSCCPLGAWDEAEAA